MALYINGKLFIEGLGSGPVALSDALANPSITSQIGANLLLWDAVNSLWKRVTGRAMGAGEIANTEYAISVNAALMATEIGSGNPKGLAYQAASSDGIAATYAHLLVNNKPYQWNGATYDRTRDGAEITVKTSAAQTASANGADVTVYNLKAAQLVLDATTVTGTTPTLDVIIQGKDTLSGKYYTLGTFPQLTAAGTKRMVIGLGVGSTVADARSSEPLPRIIRYVSTITGTDPSFTYSIGLTGQD